MEKKKINKKKLLIVLIILIILIGITSFFVVRYIKGNVAHFAPSIEIDEQKDDGMIKYENNIQGITIRDRTIEKNDGKQYIMIEIQNNTEEDKFDLPIGIEFVNLDGDVIYNTGYVVDVLLKGMTDRIHALITPEIANLVNKKKIDHIVINQL